MTQQTPTQELMARDLHGIEWHFKHIFRGFYLISAFPVFLYCRSLLLMFMCHVTKYMRVNLSDVVFLLTVRLKMNNLYEIGQPRRHLLTTGWSTFVTSKKLVAGDSFVFLR